MDRRPPRLRMEVAVPERDAWVVGLLLEVCGERGWTADDAHTRADAVAIVSPLGVSAAPVDEPALVIQVEAGTPRSPVVEESAPHLVARTELVIGGFKARRNQRVTREAIERFLERAERERPAAEPLVTDDPAEAADRRDAAALIAEHRALLAAVDEWLARTTTTPEAAQAIAADRAIVDAALGAPVIDLVILERAASRLAATIEA